MNCRVGRAEMSMKCDVTAGVLMWNWKLQWEMEVTGNHSEVGSIFFNSRVLFSLAVNAIFQQVLDFMQSGKPEQTLTNPIRRGRYLVDYSQSSTCTTLQLTEQTVWGKKKKQKQNCWLLQRTRTYIFELQGRSEAFIMCSPPSPLLLQGSPPKPHQLLCTLSGIRRKPCREDGKLRNCSSSSSVCLSSKMEPHLS